MTVDVRLREVSECDLHVFYEHQIDPDAIEMAAFPPRDRDAFMEHWTKKILDNAPVVTRTILVDDQVAGYVVTFQRSEREQREVGYWIGKQFWGRGVATRALAAFLECDPARPLYAHVAKHNRGSVRVLEKCGFTICDENPALPVIGSGGDNVEEFLMRLDRG